MASIAPCSKPQPKPNWSARVQASPTSPRRSGCGQVDPIGGSAATVGSDESCSPVGPPGGGVKSLAPLGARYRVGLTHRFFLAPGGLNYFVEIKEFKQHRDQRAIAIRVIA